MREVKRILSQINYRIDHSVEYNEYRCAPTDVNKETAERIAYYTDDLRDCAATAIMNRKHESNVNNDPTEYGRLHELYLELNNYFQD
jgi:hypothetical protein